MAACLELPAIKVERYVIVGNCTLTGVQTGHSGYLHKS
jgi:hypothetical protein